MIEIPIIVRFLCARAPLVDRAQGAEEEVRAREWRLRYGPSVFVERKALLSDLDRLAALGQPFVAEQTDLHARLLAESGRIEDAIARLRQGVELLADPRPVRRTLGLFLLDRERAAEALPYLRLAARDFSDDAAVGESLALAEAQAAEGRPSREDHGPEEE